MPPPDDDELDEALPYDAEDEYIPPPKEQRYRPGVFSALLALVAAAGFGAVAYAPERDWFTTGLRTPRAQTQQPFYTMAVDGRGERSLAVEVGMLGPRKSTLTPLPADVAPQGDWLRVAAITGGAWLLVGMVVLFAGPGRAWGGRLRTLVPGIATSFAIALLVWSIGWLVKVVMLSRMIAERIDQTPGLLRGGFQVDTQPGLGLYVALGGSLGAAAALSALSQWCLRGTWSYAFTGLGALAGAAVLGLVVRPWDAEPLWNVIFK